MSSFREFILGLTESGFATAEQSLAAAEARARPSQLNAIIATLPAVRRVDPRFAARIAAGRTTADQVDEFFRAGARRRLRLI